VRLPVEAIFLVALPSCGARRHRTMDSQLHREVSDADTAAEAAPGQSGPLGPSNWVSLKRRQRAPPRAGAAAARGFPVRPALWTQAPFVCLPVDAGNTFQVR
jgi:hypothetical protein